MIKGLTLRLSMPDIAAVARSLLGVLVVAVVALHWGSAGAATAAAGAAAIAGATALQDSPRGRIPLVLVVSALMGAAVFLGTLTSAYSAIFVGVVALWCFAAGMQWALGANAGLIAAAASALLVTVPQSAPSFSSVVGSTALTVAAGLTQAALIAIWPQRRWRVQRDALVAAYRSLGIDARRLATNPDAHVDPESLIWLRDAFTLTEGQARRRPPEYRGWYGLPERIAMTLTALSGKAVGDEALARVLTSAADTLEAIVTTSRSEHRDAEDCLVRLDNAVGGVTGPEVTVVRRLSDELHEAVALRLGEFSPSPADVRKLRRPNLTNFVRSTSGTIRGHLSWQSPVVRHAVRLASAVAAGSAFERFAGVDHGYWIPLTVLMVLRPETAHTYTRCVGRVAGNAAGIVIASVVTMIWHPTGLVSAALSILLIGVAYAVSGFGYLALSAALAAAIVFLIDIDGFADAATLGDRLFATIIGGALALLAHVALPDHALIRLRQRAGELLRAEIDYAATVIRAFVHELDNPKDLVSAAWQRALRARAAFEAAAGATRLESGDLRRWLRSYRTALNVVTSSCTTMEASLSAHPSVTLTREFVLAVDEYVEAMRGDPPTPAIEWTIDAGALATAFRQVRAAAASLTPDETAARVLVAEIATITRNLSAIAPSRDIATP